MTDYFYGPGKENVTVSPVGRVLVQQSLERAGEAWTAMRKRLLLTSCSDAEFILTMSYIDELVQAEVALALARQQG